MSKPRAFAENLEVIELHVDMVHRDALRSTTDSARGLPRFKTKAQQAKPQRSRWGWRIAMRSSVDFGNEGRLVTSGRGGG